MNTIEEIGHCVTDIKSHLLTQYDRLDQQTKSAFEELTVLKNRVDNQSGVLEALQRVNLQMKREQRLACEDPIQRIAADDPKRNYINAAVRHLCGAGLTEIHKRALGADSSPGSAYIAGDLARDIFDVLSRYGQWNTLGVRRVSTKTTTFPVKTARPAANWILTENSQISDDSNKAGVTVDLTIKLMAVLLNVSLPLIQDSEFDITADLLDDFAEACALRLDWAAFASRGNNDAVDGGFTGIFAGSTPATASDGNTSVSTLDFEDVTRCLTTVAPAVLRRPARWWMHPQILVRLLHVRDGNGRPLFLTATEAPSLGGIGTILGYPVVLCDAAPCTDSAGKAVAVFGDPQGCVVGVRQDFEFAASDHHGWDFYQRSFRGIVRAGVKIRSASAFAALTLAPA